MKKEEHLTLIDSDFTSSNAKVILINVFFNKIQFHEMKHLSSKERYGKENDTVIKRIPLLRACTNELSKIQP